MNCPDCRRVLPDVATACRCGWVAPQTVAHVTCKHCPENARMRVKTADGWENVCEAHYIEHAQKLAAETMNNAGIARLPNEPIEKWRARAFKWLQNRSKALLKRMPGS